MKIAPGQRKQLDFLRGTLESLENTVDRSSRQGFRDLRGRLDGWAARVAVIGQVKAGKSSFLNAFLNQHDFLPSDINPWTSVVTNIRVNLPNDPVSGAKFEFFSEADWYEIVSGTSRIRKLTEQLLPGFDTQLLRKQSEEMRERAQQGLGQHYHALLGGEHSYDFLTADLLKRYVCAGPGSDEGPDRQPLGRYAAVTKVANAYMRMPEFRVPAIVTDTPGVNDPFLVRDEFTCRSLDKSDVFIVVLSAHQPLTEVDIALIRILSRQDDKDCIVFVNRIDELDDYGTEVPRVVEDVTSRLTEAIPDIEFTILAGSAFLADLALRDDAEAKALREAADDDELRWYLEATYGEVPEDRLDRLFLASGLTDVKATLSEVIDHGIGCRQLGQLLEDIRAEVNGVQFVTRRERDSLKVQIEKLGGKDTEGAVEKLEREIAAIRDIQRALDRNVEAAQGHIENVVTRAWSALEGRLIEAVEGFVREQRRVFEEGLFRNEVTGTASASLQIDLAPLALRLEKEVEAGFEKSRAGTDAALSNCIHACRQTILTRFDDPTGSISLDELPFDSFASTLTLSKRSLQMEMIADRGWAFWRRPALSVEKSVDALRVIAVEELRPAIEKLLAAFNEAQVERASAGTARIQVMQRMIETSLTERTQRHRRDKAELERIAGDPDAQMQMAQRLHSQMEVLERRLINLAVADSALSKTELQAAAA